MLRLVFAPKIHVKPIVIALKDCAGIIDLPDVINRMLDHDFNDPQIRPRCSSGTEFCELGVCQSCDATAETGVGFA